MKTALKLLAFVVTVANVALAQVVPEATGPGLPVSGKVHYDLHYSEIEYLGGSVNDSQSAVFSGNVEYANLSDRLPFSLKDAGGYSWAVEGAPYGVGPFDNLSLSQGFVRRKWNLQFSDSASYRKEAPTTGFSGVPGTGEPIGGSTTPPSSSQSILTLNTSTVDNSANAEFERTLNYATTLNLGGNSELLRYPDENGIDTDNVTANAGLTQRLNARNSLSYRYLFSEFSYPDGDHGLPTTSLITNSALFGYQRHWTRQITTNAAVGPEWVEGANSAVVPSSTRVSGNASFEDQFRFGSVSLNYSHTTSGGGGFLVGGEVDSASAGFTREFKKTLTTELSGGYMHTSGLGTQGKIDSEYGAAMVTWRLSRYFTAFASYTADDQTSSSSLPSNALNQMLQVISVGIGYSPRERHIEGQ
ncbi:MAG: hypothetical protein ACLQDA_10855 [Terracidiphilus sp.]